MPENDNFDWISEVKPYNTTTKNLIVFCKQQPPNWNIVTDAAIRVLLFGLNGGLASKADLLPYFAVVDDKIKTQTLDEDAIFMLAIDMTNSSYFHPNCCANVPIKSIHTEILSNEYSKRHMN